MTRRKIRLAVIIGGIVWLLGATVLHDAFHIAAWEAFLGVPLLLGIGLVHLIGFLLVFALPLAAIAALAAVALFFWRQARRVPLTPSRRAGS